MKIVVAPDKFKGSLSAESVGRAIIRGLLRAGEAETVLMPMADGGDGTVDALIGSTGGQKIAITVTDPLGRPIRTHYGVLGDGRTAVIEMALAAGLTLLKPEERNPLVTTTYGVGELILDASKRGIKRVVLGIGGSATNDGGAGMASALGVRLLDEHGTPLPHGGSALTGLQSIDTSGLAPSVRDMEFVVACDVDNPLVGAYGASAVYGPQKGATPEMTKTLDAALANFAQIIERDCGMRIKDVPGAGAAGGLGAGLMAFLAAELRSGIDLVMETSGFLYSLEGASLVITGEGKMDNQTLMGKVPYGVAKAASEKGVPVFAIVGSYTLPLCPFNSAGIDAVFAAQTGPATLEQSMAKAEAAVESVSEQVYRVFLTGRASQKTAGGKPTNAN